MLLNLLSATPITNCIADIVVVLFAFILVNVCAKKGFINCFFGTISTLLAFLVAMSFTEIFVNITGGLFGLDGFIQGKLETAFTNINGFNADISQSGVEAAIQEQNVPAILAGLVMKLVGSQETIPTGTTLAMLLSDATSSLGVTLIAGVTLFVVTKLFVRLMRGILTVIADSIQLIHGVNLLLGALVGFLEASLIVCGILAVFAIFPNEDIVSYLSKTIFLGELYVHNPLITIMGFML